MKNNSKGFTLLELSIVLAIMGILTIGFVQGNIMLIRKNRISGTETKLDLIEKALMTHLLLNGNLPCPANINALEGATDFGDEQITCSGTGITAGLDTNFVAGGVPTATLNLSDDIMQDQWGNKFTYYVNINHTQAGGGFRSQDPTANSITIYTENTSNTLSTRAIYSIVSHGENGLGAYGYNSSVQGASTGATAAEQSNIVSANFATENFHNVSDGEFDDIVRYKTKNQLIIDLDWEDVGCFIDMNLLNGNEPDSSCVDLTANPSSSFLNYNKTYGEGTEDWDTLGGGDCCIARCYKYGRVGFYLKGSACD